MDKSIVIKTGFEAYDEKCGGLHRGQVILVGGRPCMGKTAFALSLVDNICRLNEGKCLYFSLEMTSAQIFERLLKMHCGFRSLDRISPEEWDNVAKEGRNLSDMNIILDGGAMISIERILSKSIEVASDGEISVIVVDGVNRIINRDGNACRNVSRHLKKLKELAKVLNCPVIACTQLKRSVEKNKDCRPEIKDIYDSSNVTKSVDEVIFPYREEYYDKDSMDKGKIEIGTVNFTSGEGCTFQMDFDHSRVRINETLDVFGLR